MGKEMKRILFILIIILAFILRIYQLGLNPPALNWDEASLGYNAYTIATSLHDEHGEYLPLARFIAFGDYKPPGYIYAAAASLILFGLNEFAVRFPSMLAGLLLVIMTYYLTKELFKNKQIALLASFILAVSPWAIQFSRSAYEANLATLFNLLGIYFFVISGRKKWTIILSLIFFILSFYTFNANRIIASLLLASFILLNLKTFFTAQKKWIIISIIVSLIMLAPSISYLTSRESKLRFQEVSIFNNLEPVKVANNRIAMDENSWWGNIIHNRRLLFTSDFLRHYIDNFALRFLFTHGDVNPRLAVQTMGELYVWDLPFLLLGVYFLIRKKEKYLPVLIAWMLIVPIPAATARETPHALRILSILPTYQIIIAYGIFQIYKKIRSRFQQTKTLLVIFSVICFVLSASIFYYLHDYYIHYARDWSGEWQYGYKEMVSNVLKIENNYDHIYVTNSLGRPYIYFAFYKPYPISEFTANIEKDRDWFGFWDVKTLGKIQFNFDGLQSTYGKLLIVTTPNNIPSGFHELTRVRNLAGDDVFVIGERT